MTLSDYFYRTVLDVRIGADNSFTAYGHLNDIHNPFHRKKADMTDTADKTNRRLIFSITHDNDLTDEEILAMIVAAEPKVDVRNTDPEEEPPSST